MDLEHKYYDYKFELIKQIKTDDCIVFVLEVHSRDKCEKDNPFYLSSESEAIVVYKENDIWNVYTFESGGYEYRKGTPEIKYKINMKLSGKDIKDIEDKIQKKFFAEMI